MFRGSSYWAALGLLLCCSHVRAQPAGEGEPTPSPEVSPDPRAQAHAAYAAGQALFKAGDYAAAKASFEQAYRQVPNPIVLLSIAECELRLGDVEQAHTQLERYLTQRPNAPDRDAVARRAAELRAKPALLLLSSQPSGAAIHVDGRDSGAETPAALLVTPGEHVLTFTRAGHEPVEERVKATMGAQHRLRPVLRPVAQTAEAPLAADARGTGPGAEIWIAGILGGVGLATGTVLGIMALDRRDQFERMPTAALADEGERLALFADVAFALGAVSLITTAVLCLTADDERPGPVAAAGAQAALAWSATVAPRAVGVAASGRF